MPGFLPHVLAGCTMFIIGRVYYNSYFKSNNKTSDIFLLVVICVSFSIIPDFFLGIYYTTHALPKSVFLTYHDFISKILIPISFIALLILYFINVKRKPLWIMGFWCIILHILMDLFIPGMGILI
jgi:hypothetical protein